MRARQLRFLLIMMLQNGPNRLEQFLVTLYWLLCCALSQSHATRHRTPDQLKDVTKACPCMSATKRWRDLSETHVAHSPNSHATLRCVSTGLIITTTSKWYLDGNKRQKHTAHNGRTSLTTSAFVAFSAWAWRAIWFPLRRPFEWYCKMISPDLTEAGIVLTMYGKSGNGLSVSF